MNNTNTQQATNWKGVTFNVRLVWKGDRYGLRHCLTHDETDPLVEVYDTRYPHTDLGQFVSRYIASDLLKDWDPDHPHGIILHGTEPNWVIDALPWAKVLEWVAYKVTITTA